MQMILKSKLLDARNKAGYKTWTDVQIAMSQNGTKIGRMTLERLHTGKCGGFSVARFSTIIKLCELFNCRLEDLIEIQYID